MKHLKKGIDERASETKFAYKFCESLENKLFPEELTLEQVNIMLDTWINENVTLTSDFALIEETVHKILGYNGFNNFLFAIEDKKRERFRSEIKYKIIDHNGLSELTMVAYLKNSLDVNEATELIKKYYNDVAHFGELDVQEACNSIHSETKQFMGKGIREKLLNDFYYYDENSIEIISINGLYTKDIESIEYKITLNIMKDRIKKHLNKQ